MNRVDTPRTLRNRGIVHQSRHNRPRPIGAPKLPIPLQIVTGLLWVFVWYVALGEAFAW